MDSDTGFEDEEGYTTLDLVDCVCDFIEQVITRVCNGENDEGEFTFTSCVYYIKILNLYVYL